MPSPYKEPYVEAECSSVSEAWAERLNQPRLALTWSGAISQGGQAASKRERDGSLQKEQHPADTMI